MKKRAKRAKDCSVGAVRADIPTVVITSAGNGFADGSTSQGQEPIMTATGKRPATTPAFHEVRKIPKRAMGCSAGAVRAAIPTVVITSAGNGFADGSTSQGQEPIMTATGKRPATTPAHHEVRKRAKGAIDCSVGAVRADIPTVVITSAGNGFAVDSAPQVQSVQQSSSSSHHQPLRFYLDPEAEARRSGKSIHPTSRKRSNPFKEPH